MDFQNYKWCKPDWCFPSMSKETIELLKQCIDLPKLELSDNIDEIIRKSKEFPVPFPIETVRLDKLKGRRPIERLNRNIVSTYPIIHERVLLLMTHFLIYKRKFGTSIEKQLYKDMSVPELIDRILKKRAVTFFKSCDHYKLLSGEEGKNGWESIGTVHQKSPLLLENCLSYDEVKLSSMVYVSGYTECINDGKRKNAGAVREENIEPNAVIIGIIGPRFKRKFRMEYEDTVITKQQNCLENGYGGEVTPTNTIGTNQSAKRMWRQMWSDFYQVPSHIYAELDSQINTQSSEDEQYMDKYVKTSAKELFDNEVYYKRVSVTAECVLLEGEERARAAGRDGYINVIGAGLGVWMMSSHQIDIYVLTFLERISTFLKEDILNHVSDVNFAYIQPSDSVLALFKSSPNTDGSSKKIFFKSKNHPRGGINVQLENREPSSKLVGEHEGKLLILTYPWDGNAHPGNEFWLGKVASSGDSAAASSTQVAELHNAHVNAAVSGANARVAGRLGVSSLAHYCPSLIT